MGLASNFIKGTLKKPELLETTVLGKLGSKFVGNTNNLRNVNFKFNKIVGAVESGLEMDLEFDYDGHKYTYKGHEQFKATKDGKPAGDGSAADKDLKGDSIEMVASDLIAAYAKAIGATSAQITDLIDNTMGEFTHKGNIVFEASPSQQADDAETAELAKLSVEQLKMVKELSAQISQVLDKAVAYDRWLEKNKVQAHLSRDSEGFAKQIMVNLDKIKGIV